MIWERNAVLLAALAAGSYAMSAFGEQDVLGYGIDPEKYRAACPDYRHYSMMPQYASPYTGLWEREDC